MSIDAGNSAFINTVLASILSSTGLWGAVQLLLTRRQRREDKEKEKIEAKKAEQQEQERRESREQERREMLAEAQATAQVTALNSAKERYEGLQADYQACRTDLDELREATWGMLSIVEALLVRLVPHPEEPEKMVAAIDTSQLGEIRRSINEVRRHLR